MPLVVQLVNGRNRLCWGASYNTSQLLKSEPHLKATGVFEPMNGAPGDAARRSEVSDRSDTGRRGPGIPLGGWAQPSAVCGTSSVTLQVLTATPTTPSPALELVRGDL
jgi:hypothetical protein